MNRATIILLLLSLLAFLGACSDDADVAVVDFKRKVEVRRSEADNGERDKLRVAVGAMISPRETAVQYHDLLYYIADRQNRDIELVQRKTYGQLNALFGSGEIDLAFICSGPYATDKDAYRFVGLAVPVVRGKHTYRSYLIVHKDSPYRRLQDLQGKTFAFTDPDSNTGKLVPTYWLALAGTTPEKFFGNVLYTYSHDNSIMAVANALVDGASVHQQIWEYYNEKDPAHTSKTRIIKKSDRFGNPLMVASAFLETGLKREVQELMLTMHLDEPGKNILKRLMIDRFIAPDDDWYTSIIAMKKICQLTPE